jgi:hypothetical protein
VTEEKTNILVSDSSASEESENESKGVSFPKNCVKLASASRQLPRGTEQ